MTFLLPVSFFSIFAMIFGGQGHNATSRIDVAVADEDHTELSRRMVQALRAEPGLNVRVAARPAGSGKGAPEAALDRARAREMVREGEVPVAVILPPGLDASFGRFDGGGPSIDLLADLSDPNAPRMV